MLCKQKNSGNWWIKYYRNERPVRESTGTMKETEAKNIESLDEVLQKAFPPAA
jgi:hypothetical protein